MKYLFLDCCIFLFKIGILPSSDQVSTIVWLHCLDLNKMPGEKTT